MAAMLKTKAARGVTEPRGPFSPRPRWRRDPVAGHGRLWCDNRPTGLVRYIVEATRRADSVTLFMFSPYLPALRGQELMLQLEDGREIHFTGDGEMCQVIREAAVRHHTAAA